MKATGKVDEVAEVDGGWLERVESIGEGFAGAVDCVG